MKKHEIIEINNERIYLRKGFLGWNIIYPNRIDGKKNWKHIIAGKSWWNLLGVILLVLLILGCIYEYSNALNVANECLKQTQIIKYIPLLT